MRIATGRYTEAEVIKAVHAPDRYVRFRYELLSKNLQYKRDIETIRSASIEYNSDDSICRLARFRMHETDIDYLSNRIRPVFCLQMHDGWAEWPLGVFVLATPSRMASSETVERSVEAYDLTQLLRTDSFIKRKFFSAGIFYTDAVRNILIETGYSLMNVPHSTKRLPTAIEFPIGHEKLDAINQLLAAINYTNLFADEYGIFSARPIMPFTESAVQYHYSDNESSIMKSGSQENVDFFHMPNRFIGYTSTPDRGTMFAIWENTDPLSPLSTVNRSVVTLMQEVSEIADQASLNQYVAEWGRRESAAVFEIEFSTGLVPFHGYKNIYRYSNSVLNLDGYYEEIAWSMDLTAGGIMNHVARRI